MPNAQTQACSQRPGSCVSCCSADTRSVNCGGASLFAALLAANGVRCSLCTPSSSSREPAGGRGHGVLKKRLDAASSQAPDASLCVSTKRHPPERRERRGLCSIGKRSRSPWRRNLRPALLCATLAVRLPVQPYRRHSPPPSQSSILSAHNRIPRQSQLLLHLTSA